MTLDLTAPGFSLTNARVCAQACADSYQNTECGVRSAESGTPNSEFRISNSSTDTHVLIRDLGNALIVAFRGSASLRNWLTDFDAMKKAIADGHVHAGFQNAFDSVAPELQDSISHSGRKVILLTGHSLGGALAAIAGVELTGGSDGVMGKWSLGPQNSNTPILHSVYTFGQPRVGDARFTADAARCGIAARHFRVTNGADIVPWVPGWLMGYRHFGQHIHFDALGMHNNPLPLYQLSVNGREMWREFRRGDAAMLTDHAIARYQEAVG